MYTTSICDRFHARVRSETCVLALMKPQRRCHKASFRCCLYYSKHGVMLELQTQKALCRELILGIRGKLKDVTPPRYPLQNSI
jgi:hypothetical protein